MATHVDPRMGHAALRLQRFGSVEAFLGVVADFLADREAEHNLIFGICHNLLTAPHIYPSPPYLAAVTDAAGEVVAAAIQTPPWQLVLSETDVPASIDLVVEDRIGDWPPGVLGSTPLAARFARIWHDRTGVGVRLETRERILSLSAVVPPRRATGSMRAARPADRALLVQWLTEFTDEALGGEQLSDVEVMAERGDLRRFTSRPIRPIGGKPKQRRRWFAAENDEASFAGGCVSDDQVRIRPVDEGLAPGGRHS